MLADIRSAAHALARWRLGAIVAVATLAIGIGATTALYAVAKLAIPDFPLVPQPDRLARIYVSNGADKRLAVSLQDFASTLSATNSFEAAGAYGQTDARMQTSAGAESVSTGYVSPGFFAAFAVRPSVGRVLVPDDFSGDDRVVVVSDRLWRRQFSDGRVAGRSLRLDNVDRRVVGVMPAEFSYSFVGMTADVWLPMTGSGRRRVRDVTVFARLRSDIDWMAARAELAALGRARGYAAFRAISLDDDARDRSVGAYGFTLGPAVVVLLLGCVNVSCMLMARGMARDKELSVRRALGATRLRVVRQLMTESALLAAAGGALGSVFAFALLRVVASRVAAFQPSLSERVMSGAEWLPLAGAATLMACLLFGAVPAIRLSGGDVAGALNGVPPKHRIHIVGYGARDLIVFFEVGVATGLIVFAAMIFNLFTQMQRVTPLFAADRVVVMKVAADDLGRTAERAAALPGAARVAVASKIPGGVGSWRAVPVYANDGPGVPMQPVAVGDGFFETLGLSVSRGRSFSAAEISAGSDVAVLSVHAARALAVANPLGTRLRLGGTPQRTVTVIGVCQDAIDFGALSTAGLDSPALYVPFGPAPQDAMLLVRASGDAPSLARALSKATADLAEPTSAPTVLSETLDFHNSGTSQLIIGMIGSFGALALLLAATGILGVVGQSVAQRTREFGIRRAVGATMPRVFAMVLARESKLVLAAVLSGMAVTLGLTRVLFVELARLTVATPYVWVGVALMCGGTAVIACLIAMRRITRVDPWTILRRI